LIVKVPWTICACLCLIIGMHRFMQSESFSLVELQHCILEATRPMSDVNRYPGSRQSLQVCAAFQR
jgi:hypothetical protein